MFIIRNNKVSKTVLETEATRVINVLFKSIKASNGSDFDPASYYSDPGEFITHISLSLNFPKSKFNLLEQTDPWYFTRLNDQVNFEGALEIEKVGENINNAYPAGLNRAYYREELISRLSSIVYKKENTPIVVLGKDY